MLRELKIEVGIIGNASSELESINSQVDVLETGLEETREDIKGLGEETKTYSEETKSTLMDSISNWTMYGAGMIAAGAALEGLLRSTQDLRYEFGVAASHFNITNDEMYNMATEASNATLSLDEVSRATARLIQFQVDDVKVAGDLVKKFDMLADATGIDIVDGMNVANTVFRVMGEEIENVGEYLDSFVWLSRHTTTNLNYFQRGVMEFGGELQAMGFGIDDIIIMFAAMQEAGIENREMMRSLRSAINDSDGTQKDFYRTLGVTSDQIDNQTQRLAENAGIAEENSGIYANSKTILQEFQTTLGDLNLKLGEKAAVYDWLSPLLLGVGTLLISLPTITKSLGIMKGIALAIAGGVSVATLGIGAIVIAAGVGIWQAVEHWDQIKEGWSIVKKDLSNIWDSVTDTSALQGAASSIGDAFSPVWDSITGTWQAVESFLSGIDLSTIGRNIISGLTAGIVSAKDSVVEGIRGIAESMSTGFKDAFGIASPSKLMFEYGGSIVSGLNAGLSQTEPGHIPTPKINLSTEPGHIPTPKINLSPVVAVAGGGGMTFAPVINVSGFAGDASDLASKIDGRIRATFTDAAERYFASQRRRRPRKREEELI